MSERYSRLFTLPENLYATGSPVVIAAGTLLKDNQTGNIVAQLKLRSISNKIIKAVRVKLDLYDTSGKALGETVEYDYLDLHAARDTEFGQKIPVWIANNKARSYTASVTEVVFIDQSIGCVDGNTWEPLEKPVPLYFPDTELLKQYQLRFGSTSKYKPKREKDLWYCTCGALNHAGENCHTCGKNLTALLSLNMAELEAEKNTRLAAEAKQAEERAIWEAEEARKIAEEKMAQAVEIEQANKKIAKILKVVFLIACIIIALVILQNKVIIPNTRYNKAVSLGEKGDIAEAAIMFGSAGDIKDARERSFELWDSIAVRDTICAGLDISLGLKANGTVISAGGYASDTNEITSCANVIAIAMPDECSIGLKSDGTLIADGYSRWGAIDVMDWKDIVAIAADGSSTVGLKSDGTVLITGAHLTSYVSNREIKQWKGIKAISTSGSHIVGIKLDDTVIAAGRNNDGECNVEDWTNIVDVSAGDGYTAGIKSDGTVVVVGENSHGAHNISDWTNIVAISTGYDFTVGLKADGTVVAVGCNEDGQCDVSSWTDIVAISAGYEHTIGLKSDGTVVTAGNESNSCCQVSDWKNMKLPQ